MRIVLAPDSFKECLTAVAVCDALAHGIRRAHPEAHILARPMADGGEGTGDVLRNSLDCQPVVLRVMGPLGQTIESSYELSRDGKTAVIETSRANGLHLVPTAERNPMHTTTFGCGMLAADAINRGVDRLLLTIGGSATVDGGIGLAKALGYRFLNADGNEVADGGQGLMEIATIEAPASRPWESAEVQVVCDVTNPLLGATGAARVFGPQKGATPDMVELLEQGLGNLARVIQRDLGIDVSTLPGGGAAGGMGAGLAAFLHARLMPGSELVMDLIGMDDALQGADLVITGEGRTDGQTADGKVCAGVASRARKLGVPCVVISGGIAGDLSALKEIGVTAAFSLSNGPETLEQAMAAASDRLSARAEAVVALIQACS